MTKKELEAMVSGVKSPPLDRKQTRKLFEENSSVDFQQGSSNEVAQRYIQPVAQEVAQRYIQPVAQEVAQRYTQPVAQEVAQPLWVAQEVSKKVAQHKPKKVAQDRPQLVAQHKPKQVAQSSGDELTKELSVLKYVNELQDKMKAITGIEERKKFANDIGWGIMCEKRGKQYYLFGGKKLNGKKRKLYIGNAKK